MASNQGAPSETKPTPHASGLSRAKTYALTAGIIVALILSGAAVVTSVTAPHGGTSTVTTPIYNNATVFENYTSWHNGTLYANSTIVQNRTYLTDRTLYANSTYWDNETSTQWANSTLYYNTTVLAPVVWPVQIDGLTVYLVCTGGNCTNVSATVNTTNGAGTDELFGVQLGAIDSTVNSTIALKAVGLVSYDPTNVTNTSVSPFFLWQTLTTSPTSLALTPACGGGMQTNSTAFRAMVEAPEAAGSYYLGIAVYLEVGTVYAK